MKLKRLMSVSVIAAFFILGIFSVTGVKGLTPPIPPELIEKERTTVGTDSIISAYKSRAMLNLEGRAALTNVVEVALPAGTTQSDIYLVNVSDGEQQPVVFKRNTTEIKTPFTVSQNRKPLQELFDKNPATGASFPVETQMFNQTTTLEVTLSAPTVLSGVQLPLDQYSKAPVNVSVSGVVDPAGTTAGTESAAEDKAIILNQVPYNSLIRFPSQIVSRLFITFSHNQPLRFTEVGLVQSDSSLVSQQEIIRFLAQPGYNYMLYLDKDPLQTIQQPMLEVGNLLSRTDVLKYDPLQITENPRYRPADKDEDGVLDADDNCPSIFNPNQSDENLNLIGDHCEDFDSDGILNATDNCPEHANAAQADTDGDKIGDRCDREESRLTEQNPWLPWAAMGVTGVIIAGLFYSVLKSKKLAPVVPNSSTAPENPDSKKVL